MVKWGEKKKNIAAGWHEELVWKFERRTTGDRNIQDYNSGDDRQTTSNDENVENDNNNK